MTARDYKDTGHFLVGGGVAANTDHNDLCQGGQNSEQGTLMSTDSELLLEKGIETAAACWQSYPCGTRLGKGFHRSVFLSPGGTCSCPVALFNLGT